jgi:hypothetical protein
VIQNTFFWGTGPPIYASQLPFGSDSQIKRNQ